MSTRVELNNTKGILALNDESESENDDLSTKDGFILVPAAVNRQKRKMWVFYYHQKRSSNGTPKRAKDFW